MSVRLLQWLNATPLHPQWLIRRERHRFSLALGEVRGRVLDVGCGDRWVERALGRDCTYVALDSLATGRDRYYARPSVFADAGALPFNTGAMDAVVMFEVLEHVAAPRAVLDEACRCLAPGGLLVASVPFLYPIHDAPTDFQRYTEHGLREVMERSGLEVVSIERRLASIQTAALVATLAMGAAAKLAIQRIGVGSLLLPLWAVAIPLVNIGAVLLGAVAPDWRGMSNGYVALGRKPRGGTGQDAEVIRAG